MIKSWNKMTFWKTDTYKELENIDGLPRKDLRKRAFDLCRFNDTNVVILGQDPYHTPGIADGLAFSTWPHIKKIPPSLTRIYSEYQRDLKYPRPYNGSLEKWARNGVLLLNTSLSVEPNKPGSHRFLGWEKLILEVFKHLQSKEGLVYLLWGKHAQEFERRIDHDKNLVLLAGHPSPLNTANNFLGCSHFSKACEYLKRDKTMWKLT